MKDTCKQTSQHRRAPRVELICTGRDQPKSRIRIFQHPWIYAGPSTRIPIILSLYLKPWMYSQHCFMAINSEPKLLDSTLVCFFDDQYTNALFKYTRNPVRDLLVIVSAVWSASTFSNHCESNSTGLRRLRW